MFETKSGNTVSVTGSIYNFNFFRKLALSDEPIAKILLQPVRQKTETFEGYKLRLRLVRMAEKIRNEGVMIWKSHKEGTFNMENRMQYVELLRSQAQRIRDSAYRADSRSVMDDELKLAKSIDDKADNLEKEFVKQNVN